MEDVKQAGEVVGVISAGALVALMLRESRLQEEVAIAALNETTTTWGPPKPSLAGEWGRRKGMLAAVPNANASSLASDLLPLVHLSDAVYEKDFEQALLEKFGRFVGEGRVEVVHSHKGGIHIPCHCIAVDRKEKRVFVIIRGTAEVSKLSVLCMTIPIHLC